MFKIIIITFVALLLVQSESHKISTRSVASDVEELIKSLNSTITTKTNLTLRAFNRCSTALETYINNIETNSNTDFTNAVKGINEIVDEYQESAKSLNIDISSCSDSILQQVETLAHLEISVYNCVKQIYNSFDSKNDAAKTKLEDISEEVAQLQNEASACLNDEPCLLGVKAKCLKYQSYFPFEILLYTDKILWDYLLAQVYIDKCTYDYNLVEVQYDISSTFVYCVINAVNPATSTSAPTLTTARTPTNKT